MRKEYTKETKQKLDENQQPIGEPEVYVYTSLIADIGMMFKDLRTGEIAGVRIDIGTDDSEENYTEVDDPKYVEVIDAITEEVAKNEV